MKILAFETSCDDTAIAIVENGTTVLSSIRVSQVQHSQWGGVVPELAGRLHSENWRSALEQCLHEAQLAFENLDFFAVTQGPGLPPALLNGTTAASFLSLLFQKPLIPVHHIYGHICSVFLERDVSDIPFPSLVLTVSGGHTQMHLWRDFMKLELIGSTIDDAAGEAFDKVAKMLGLGYPGGPMVSKFALGGDAHKYKLPYIYLDKVSLNFSFSGLKAAVYRHVEQYKKDQHIEKIRPQEDETFIRDICAGFQHVVAKIFKTKVDRVLSQFPEIHQVIFVGGVSANKAIQESLLDLLNPKGKNLILPTQIEYSTDNAAMIGSAAYFLVKQSPEIAKIQFVDMNSRMRLEEGFYRGNS